MLAWKVTMYTPEYPKGRDIILIANDITFANGAPHGLRKCPNPCCAHADVQSSYPSSSCDSCEYSF